MRQIKRIAAFFAVMLLMAALCALPVLAAENGMPPGRLIVVKENEILDEDIHVQPSLCARALYNAGSISVSADGSFSVQLTSPAYSYLSKDYYQLEIQPMSISMSGQFDLDALADRDVPEGPYVNSADVAKGTFSSQVSYTWEPLNDERSHTIYGTETTEGIIAITYNKVTKVYTISAFGASDNGYKIEYNHVGVENTFNFDTREYFLEPSNYTSQYSSRFMDDAAVIEMSFVSFTADWDGAVIAPNDKPTDVIVDTEAENTPGEDGGVSIPTAIVVGALGTVGAIGAAGAVAGATGAAATGASDGGDSGGDGETDGERRKKSYKMYIRKDFGDCIAYNKPQAAIYARMAEVDENGGEADRPDLTGQIQIFSGGAPLQAEGCAMAGNYMGAWVSAEAAQSPDRPQSGVVSFLFTGAGGSFRNNVTFRLTGEPYLTFPSRGALLTMTVPMLLGDGGDYELPFEVCDFMDKPTDIHVTPQGDAPVSCAVEENGDNRYTVQLQNGSVRPDAAQATAQVYAFEIEAKNENEYAQNRFEIHLYPEGLSVSLIRMDRGAAQVGCYRDADAPEDGDILPTRFKLELAVAETGENGVTAAKIVPYTQYMPEFGAMKGTDTRTHVLVQRYECPVEPASENKDGLYRFCPKAQLPDPKVYSFTVSQPISAEYNGVSYTLELPVRLIGEPLDVMKGWDEEYKRFVRIVKYYGLSAETAASVREMGQNRSTEELRLLNKMILIESMNYYTAEHAEFQAVGDWMGFLEDSFSGIKWFGDQAFSYLMTVTTGPLGDAILTPTKEILVSVIAESAAAFWNGDEIDYTRYDFVESLGGMLESVVMTQMSEAGMALNLAELKKLGGILAAFLMISALKHYIADLGPDNKPERCLYGALSGAFSDLTASAFKMIAGNYFEKLVKSSRGQSGLGSYLLKWWKKVFPNVDLTALTQGIGPGRTEVTLIETAKILQKYVEEVFGICAGIVIEGLSEFAEAKEEDLRLLATSTANAAWSIAIPLGNGVSFAFDPLGAMEKLCEVLFDIIFDGIPFNSAPTSPPTDPTYYKDGTAVV